MRILAALLLLVLSAPPAAAQDVLLQDAFVLDPANERVERASIVVRAGRIAAITANAPAAFDGPRVDLRGRWLMPGLNDMHVHSYGNAAPGNQMQLMMTANAARAMLFAGVTGFLDLFSAEDFIFPLRDQQRRQGVAGADIYCAGPILTCTGGHGTEYGVPTRVINTPEEARQTVAELAERRPDVVKIVYDHAYSLMPTLDRSTMAAAVQAASAHGLKSVVHIGTWQDAREAIEAGASAVTHVYGSQIIPDTLVQLIVDRGVYMIPTLVVQTEMLHLLRHPEALDDPLLRRLAAPNILAAYRDTSAWGPRERSWLSWQERNLAYSFASVRKMARAGIKVLAGTDAGNYGVFQGYSVHRELALLVESGLTPWQALRAATTLAGEFLERSFGMEPGGVANFIVLEASPLADIENTKKIALIIHHGTVIDRPSLWPADGR